MWNAGRIFFALWYLGGSLLHLWLGTTIPQGYAPFGETVLIPLVRDLWHSFLMPNMRVFAYMLAAFELTTGVLLLSKARYFRLGLVASLGFNLFLIQLGLATVTADPGTDFMWNRLPNIVFAIAQLPLFLRDYRQTLPETIASRFRPASA